MSSKPTLTNIPLELRIQIFKLLTVSKKKRVELPCCSVLAIRGPWHEIEPKCGLFDQPPFPFRERDVLALAATSQQLYAETMATVFKEATARFCSRQMSNYNPNYCEFGVRQPKNHVSLTYHPLHYALQNISIVRYGMEPGPQVLTTAYHGFTGSTARKDGEFAPMHLRGYIQNRLHQMTFQRDLVSALNASRSARELHICCTFVWERPHALTEIRDIFSAFEYLRKDIQLIIDFQVDIESSVPLPLPYNGFPSPVHTQYLTTLQIDRHGPLTSPPLFVEWGILHEWLEQTWVTISGMNDEVPQSGTRVDRFHTANSARIQPVAQLIHGLWQCSDPGDLGSYRATLKALVKHVLEACGLDGRALLDGFVEFDHEGIGKVGKTKAWWC